MDHISVSVVIPAYNSEAFLRTAIESALTQTLRPAEVLVVDDGSEDGSFKRAISIGPAVIALTKRNGGPASARNYGVHVSRGEWIGFLDADDAWLPHKLERQAGLIDSGVGLVHSKARGGPLSVPDELTFDQLWSRNVIVNSTALVRRAAFFQTGGFDPDPSLIGVEDYNLWLRIVAAGWRIRGFPEELCFYSPDSNSLSRQTLRFASASFANVRKLAAQLQLSHEQLWEKELLLCDEFGFSCLSVRDMQNARKFLWEGLGRRFTAKRLSGLAATYVPKRVLDWRCFVISRWSKESCRPILARRSTERTRSVATSKP